MPARKKQPFAIDIVSDESEYDPSENDASTDEDGLDDDELPPIAVLLERSVNDKLKLPHDDTSAKPRPKRRNAVSSEPISPSTPITSSTSPSITSSTSVTSSTPDTPSTPAVSEEPVNGKNKNKKWKDKKRASANNERVAAHQPTSESERPDRDTFIAAFLTKLDLYNAGMTPVKLNAVRRFCYGIQPISESASVIETPGTWPSWGDEAIDRQFQELVHAMATRFGIDPAKCVKPSGTLAAVLMINWNYPPLNDTDVENYDTTLVLFNYCIRKALIKLGLPEKQHSYQLHQAYL